jgi:hypothetical protein
VTQFQRKTHRARRLLESAAHVYPNAWQQIDAFRRDRGSSPDFDWPDWCYMPMAAGYAIASGGGDNRVSVDHAHHPAIITALATWRMTQGIYRYDATLRDAVLQTPLDGELPTAHLYRLPEWCVYVETDPATTRWGAEPLHGFFAHLEYDVARGGTPELRLLLDVADDPRQPFAGLVPIPLIITAPDLQTAIGITVTSGARQAAQLGVQFAADAGDVAAQTAPTIAPLVSLLLYLCADPDITRRGATAAPSNPTPVRTRRDGWRLFPADGPAEWDVGVRLGAALRAASARSDAGDETGRQVRAHVRRAHWHTILSGPRLRDDKSEIPAAERRRDLRWLPPIAVNVDDLDAMPAVVRPVRS